MKKPSKLLLALPLALLLILGLVYALWIWPFYGNRADIEGFVLLDKRFQGKAGASFQVERMGRSEFFKRVLSHYRNEHPLENATVSLGAIGIGSRTEKSGYFRINGRWRGSKNHPFLYPPAL